MAKEIEKNEAGAEVKKVFNYKGEIKEVKDLITAKGVPIQIEEVQVREFTTKFAGKQGGFKLPKLAVVTKMEKHEDNSKYLTYLTYSGAAREFKSNRKIVPADLKVKHLVGKQGTSMLDKYITFKNMNMFKDLYYGSNIGSDPEMFIENEAGKVIPAFTFLGSKAKPKHKSAQNMPVYWDGFQAEFETVAQTCQEYHSDSIQCGLKALLEAARKKSPKAKLSAKTVMEIPHEMLEKAKDEHVNFGCAPSLNAYGLKGKETPPREMPFRPAGGHIHFGIGKHPEEMMIQIVKALDAILGVACVSLFANFDNPSRREYYGLAGEYRLPKHGLEYRTLSNAWLLHPLINNLVIDLARKVLCFGRAGLLENWKGDEKETIEVINTCNVAKAREILNRNKDILLGLLGSSYKGKDVMPFYNGILNGLETMVNDPTDIEANWHLSDGKWLGHCGIVGAKAVSALPILAKGGKV